MDLICGDSGNTVSPEALIHLTRLTPWGPPDDQILNHSGKKFCPRGFLNFRQLISHFIVGKIISSQPRIILEFTK